MKVETKPLGPIVIEDNAFSKCGKLDKITMPGRGLDLSIKSLSGTLLKDNISEAQVQSQYIVNQLREDLNLKGGKRCTVTYKYTDIRKALHESIDNSNSSAIYELTKEGIQKFKRNLETSKSK